AVDDRTFRVHLAHADPIFLRICAMKFAAPIPRRLGQRRGPDDVGHPVLASGPFRLVNWLPGAILSLERNPYYWHAEIPYLDAIEFREVVPRAIAALLFLRGELDLLSRPASGDYIAFRKSREWRKQIAQQPVLMTYVESMNMRAPPFDDRRVRLA